MTEYLNDPNAAGTVRHPRTILALGDHLLDFEQVRISHTGTYQAGMFSATVRSAPGRAVGQWGWWLEQDVIVLDVYAGFPGDSANYSRADLTPMFVSRVDQIHLQAASNTITLEGRDLTAILIDQKTSGEFQNKTASDVAKQFADDAGLTANVQPTTTKIGRYYDKDHLQLVREETKWALLTYLARQEEVQCFVLGRTLYFGKFENFSKKPYLIQFDQANEYNASHASNAKRLEFEHDLTLSRDVIVTVRSHNIKTNKWYSVVAKASSGKAQAARSLTPILPKTAADPQNYTYTIPNLSPKQAQGKAMQLAQEISRHELRMTADLIGDDVLYPWVTIEVQGTNTVFDTTYYPSEVTRSMTPTEFSLTVRAKNHQTETQVSLS